MGEMMKNQNFAYILARDGNPENVMIFFFLKEFLNLLKNHKFFMVPRLVKNTQNLVTHTLS